MKRYFIVFSIGFWIVLAILSIYCIVEFGIMLSTIGIAISTLLPLVFFLGLDISQGDRFSIGQIMRIVIFIISTLLIFIDYRNVGLIIIVIYASNLVIWLLYVYWYSRLGLRESEILQLGNTLPELKFETYTNENFYASQLLGRKVVMIFYRGNWCPVDMAQLKELSIQYEDIKQSGAEILMISPQPHNKSKELAETLGAGFRFVMDRDNKIAIELGIDSKNGVPIGYGMSDYDKDTVLPTTIIVDEYQKIIYLNQTNDYRKRPETKSYLHLLNRETANS